MYNFFLQAWAQSVTQVWCVHFHITIPNFTPQRKKKKNAMKLKSFLIRTWLTFLLCIISCSNTPHVDSRQGLELICPSERMVCSGKLHHGADQSKLILGWFWATALESVKTGKRKWSFDLRWSVDGFEENPLWKMCSWRVGTFRATTKAMKKAT